MAPFNPEILITLGSLFELTSDRVNARKYYTQAISVDPQNYQALLNLAVIEYKDGNREIASELVRKIAIEKLGNQAKLITQYKILKSSLRIK